MWQLKVTTCFLLFFAFGAEASHEDDEPILYYYGLEESERGLEACAARQACGALMRRFVRASALLRLCRCERRYRCDRPAPHTRRLNINSRTTLQFCEPVTEWPLCPIRGTALTVTTSYERMNPDDLERLHHNNVHLEPPKLRFKCRCRKPNYWKLSTMSQTETTQEYECASLRLCKSGEFCGNVSFDMNALYQSCLCPKHHICTHFGGITNLIIAELLYSGEGWKAHCEPLNDYSFEDY